jgi:hypothetical protein
MSNASEQLNMTLYIGGCLLPLARPRTRGALMAKIDDLRGPLPIGFLVANVEEADGVVRAVLFLMLLGKGSR